MNDAIRALAQQATGAPSTGAHQVIQELWSGYGAIVRLALPEHTPSSVVIKHVQLPEQSAHPRGWDGDRSHQRKLRSYQVESCWYERFAQRCGPAVRVPRCFAVQRQGDDMVLILEDLDAAGFPLRVSNVDTAQLHTCIAWLARFHATFMGGHPEGLWPIGTYWHLDTRPDELEVLDDARLKRAAPIIDARLNACRFQTLVHGDAKLANFCFSESGDAVAAVDFQYVGGGCGMKDLVYFIGSCFHEAECAKHEAEILDRYFDGLQQALADTKFSTQSAAIEAEWRALFPVAWTDFHRFLKGWSPGHWKITGYSERLAREVLDQLEGEA